MKTLHNTRNCNYRRYLHKKLKHGKISGKLYKFICRTRPYRLDCSVRNVIRLVLDGKWNEDKAIFALRCEVEEMNRQKQMMQSNVECRKKIGWKQIN